MFRAHVKQILCIKLVKYWDKYTAMHGQQNVKKEIVCFLVRSISSINRQKKKWVFVYNINF